MLKSCFGSDIASQQGFGEKIRVHRVLKKKIEIWRGFGFYCRFWIESPSGICWFWLRRGVLKSKDDMVFFIMLGCEGLVSSSQHGFACLHYTIQTKL